MREQIRRFYWELVRLRSLAAVTALCLLGWVGCLGGCIKDLEPRTPMPVIRYSLAAGAHPHHSSTLIILLPGRRDRAPIFAREGFIDIMRRHGVSADLLAADAHIGYYRRGTLVRQLHEEVLEPALRHGYKHIILLGVSMGAYGAVRYAMVHPGKAETLVLLSPFLGAGPVNRDIAEAGDEDFEQTLHWLKQYPKDRTNAERAAAGYPRIILGYGDEDLFPRINAELHALLPPVDVFTTPGAHLWGTWRALLEQIAGQGLLADVP